MIDMECQAKFAVITICATFDTRAVCGIPVNEYLPANGDFWCMVVFFHPRFLTVRFVHRYVASPECGSHMMADAHYSFTVFSRFVIIGEL